MSSKSSLKHYAPTYFMNTTHKITVLLIGVGGTGSNVLTQLARINSTLIALGHPGLLVTVYDNDMVTESNLGRQLFSPSDLGRNKAEVLVERINRFFNLDWIAKNELFTKAIYANIIISCVDNMSGRKATRDAFNNKHSTNHPYDKMYYWMDFGNSQSTGQVVLGSKTIDQNKIKGAQKKLKTVFELFPQFENIKEDKNEPSCSVAESILKQDLFINSMLAQVGCDILWKLLKDKVIEYQGAFVNLETLTIKPIKIV
jgi:PRTRC genetic system ThiF family protein